MSTPPLVLQPATLEDMPAITELFYAVFTDPGMRHLFPDTPGTHQWFTATNHTDMLTKPYQKYLKVIDPSTVDAQGRARIAAYAKWDLAMADERGPRFPPWHSDMPQHDCDTFFGKLESERKRVMGDRKHYYLDMLGTHPDYRCRGAGTMLVRWGCELADREGVLADPPESAEVSSMARGLENRG
ncbi:Acyl-CoA N-acyltransferase [Penicillium bovifimosum]|uniref:Acyl-CoA N-acyltransferase n=1 Tax=Penicillium bovifimosum TaxID=126998 RepID=A0A9W9L0F2_9EURO|nr:Acyl-CoA N-acyltransferase [Penicillium bovifimosum]KAJ5131118.1 Acyl-CoA N-acyltransferase [Penicillium bovifimosum]